MKEKFIISIVNLAKRNKEYTEEEVADNILIRYEAIVKMINDGRKSTC